MKTSGRRDPKNFGGGKNQGARRGGRRRQSSVWVHNLKLGAGYLNLLARVECAAKCDRPNPKQDHIDRHRHKIIRALAADAEKENPCK